MTLMDWLNMNLIFDITAVTFVGFLCYRSRANKKKLLEIEEKVNSNKNLIFETIRNPSAAKRRLNKEK